jgi:DNA polymerase-3 subunit gamma/tau
MSLYQKYRPKDFDDLVGQQFIRKALTSALQNGKTVGAYLFCGSRGTGKTSVARILAKAVNCLDLRKDGNPCDVCRNCEAFNNGTMVDIVEIDGASNNGVDHIRELIEKAWFQPTYGKFKVYIIDEVHMLSPSAFNALLKTLEEPPEHVKFILATTEFEKVLETIVSRSQRYDFRKISDDDIVSRLELIAEREDISAEMPALRLIAQLARGGLRDAISLFEQYSVGGRLSYEFIRDNLSIVGTERLREITDTILANDPAGLAVIFAQLKTESVEPKRLLEQYLYFLRETAFAEIQSPSFPRLMRIFDACSVAYGRVKDFPNGFLLLEMTLLAQIQSAHYESSVAPARQVPAARMPSEMPPQHRVQAAKPELAIPVPAPATVRHFSNEPEYLPEPTVPIREFPIEPTVPAKKPETVKMQAAPDPIEKIPVTAPSNGDVSKTENAPAPESGDTPAKPFSFLDLVKYTQGVPKKGVLLSAIKSGTFKMQDSPPVLTVFAPSDFARKQADTPENREFLMTAIQKLF